jgi:glutathione S-transferase
MAASWSMVAVIIARGEMVHCRERGFCLAASGIKLAPMTTPARLYRFALSGHCHRVELFLSLLGVPVELVDVDLAGGEHKRAPFLAKNPLGQVPVLEDGDVTLSDSNAILLYLAGRHDPEGRWYPRDPVGAARVQQWLSLAAGQLAFGPAAARAVKKFGRTHDLGKVQAVAKDLLGHVERELADRRFLTGAAPSLADVAMYAYLARAPEGDLSLEPYPQVRAWLERVEGLRGFVAMPRFPS